MTRTYLAWSPGYSEDTKFSYEGRLRPSQFLRYAAQQIDAGRSLGPVAATGWNTYICMTLPPVDDWDEQAIVETRVMRFLLAAEIAEGEGN